MLTKNLDISNSCYLKELYGDRSALFRFLWPLTHYLVTNLCITVGYFYFHFLNKTTVLGKKNIPKKPNTLLLSNHQSMIDSFLVGLCAYYPQSLVWPSLIPWNPAAEENFFKNPFLSWLFANLKCIPIKRGRKDISAIYMIKKTLEHGPLTLFPEGTRSRDGKIGPGRAGAGFAILENWPTVIPVYIDGMDKVLPIGSCFPRFFKKIYVYFGKPIKYSEFKAEGTNKKNAQAVVDKVMEAMRNLQKEIQVMKT